MLNQLGRVRFAFSVVGGIWAVTSCERDKGRETQPASVAPAVSVTSTPTPSATPVASLPTESEMEAIRAQALQHLEVIIEAGIRQRAAPDDWKMTCFRNVQENRLRFTMAGGQTIAEALRALPFEMPGVANLRSASSLAVQCVDCSDAGAKQCADAQRFLTTVRKEVATGKVLDAPW